MKTREPRRRVILPARIRIDGTWLDVSIRNLSTRGLMIDSAMPIERGGYVEIRRGRHIIVGRAMWRQGRSVGIRAQDHIDMEAMVARPDQPSATLEGAPAEQRQYARSPANPQWSAMIGAWVQKGALGFAAIAAAGILAHSAHQTLRKPLDSVRKGLIAEERQIVAEVER